ncbi:MAG: OmpW family protein [Piscirickettsiaceae bacterium]|nr:OmpW family protein [Piscirickettsiaceae bacterium]
MKVTKLAVALLAATGISAIATPVMAYEAGDWLIRGRIINIDPQDSSKGLIVNGVDNGDGVKVDNDTIPELDITYMISPNWGVELILGYSEHTVTGEKSAVPASLGNVINAKVLPPTLLLQYHFSPNSNIRPYVGAGINYTYFFDEETTGIIETSGDNINLDSSWGFAVQAGVDIAINEDWFFNADVKYIDIDTEAHFSDILNGTADAKIKVDIDPIVWGVGIGRRF